MNLFNELVNTLLSSEDIIEEIKQHEQDVTGKSYETGYKTEKLFAAVLRDRFGPGRHFKSKEQPTGVFTKAEKDFKAGIIAWYSGSKQQDKKHIDFFVNINPKLTEEDIEEIAKKEFANIINMKESDIGTEDFELFWNDIDYNKERESAYRLAETEAEKSNVVNKKTYEVKSYKGETKKDYKLPSATLVEVVGQTGKKGWVYGSEDYIAYREKENFTGGPGFLIVNRKDLANYVDDHVDFSEDSITYNNKDAWYTQYRRTDNEGNLTPDLVTHIDLEDAKQKGVEMEFWRDPTPRA